jgi:hypothetical protein
MNLNTEISLMILHQPNGTALLRYMEKYDDGFTFFIPIGRGTIDEMRIRAEEIHRNNLGVGFSIYESILRAGPERKG